jgi:hypothetical protein
MKDYRDFPPFRYFLRVLKVCPNSALLYTQLWDKCNNMKLCTCKKNIRKEYLISPTLFRNLLSPLMSLNLVTCKEDSDKFDIEILGPNSNE